MSGAPPAANSNVRRALLTVCAMSATIMQALDTTIANVALPYMQGSLSASLDQINWVLSSYIVAAAVMTSPIGWIADRFGRKKLFMVCAAGFTFASLLCALAQNITQMVAFRLLQGMFGAALVPLSQSVMLDAYPAEQRGTAMSIWGMGVMLGPIMGPTLGGWLTETYSWHWVFLVNLPVGILTVIGLMLFMDETRPQTHLRFDWLGFFALSIGIGAMQLMLDRGEQLGWFGSAEIVAEAIVSIAGFYFFFAHALTTPAPFVRLEIFRNRNYAGACLFMVVVGVVLFSTMALSAPFLQNMLGYPILSAGWLLASRGVGTFVAMMLVGRLLNYLEPRTLLLVGLVMTAATLYQMIGFSTDTSVRTFVTVNVIQGFALGLLFVPLNAAAFATLPAHLRTDGTAILTLVRNVGASVGISIVIANLTNKTTLMHARLAEHITPFNDALKALDVAAVLNLGTDTGRALLDGLLTQQAALIAYANDFKLLMVLTIAVIPLVVVIGNIRGKAESAPGAAGRAAAPQHAAAMD